MEPRLIKVGAVVGECVCGCEPCSGLDCGPFLPRQAPRKRPEPKGADEVKTIRAAAWATRRQKYGDRGHR